MNNDIPNPVTHQPKAGMTEDELEKEANKLATIRYMRWDGCDGVIVKFLTFGAAIDLAKRYKGDV